MTQEIELIAIGVILLLQLYFFFTCQTKINSYSQLIPQVSTFSVDEKELYIEDEDGEEMMYDDVPVINTSSTFDSFEEIKTSLNKYLEKNKGATADFSLLKDIVERNISKDENAIALLIPVPLYLGLMGTLVGIIIGLWSIPSVSSEEFLQGNGIDILISGVKIAMIASLAGLVFTTYNNAIKFRAGKVELEERKNDFYTYLQSELMPVLSEGVSANLQNLFQNLASFNTNFSENVDKLNGMMNKNYESLMAQSKVLDALHDLDLNQLAKVNVTIMKELRESVDSFQQFNSYLSNVNSFVANSAQLNHQINSLLERTGEVSSIAQHINSSLERGEDLQKFLKSHFSELEKSSQALSNTLTKVEDQVGDGFDHLGDFIKQKIRAIQEISIKEEDLMKREFDENRGVLNNLNELKNIKEELAKMRGEQNLDIEGEVDRIIGALKELNLGERTTLKDRLMDFLEKIGLVSK